MSQVLRGPFPPIRVEPEEVGRRILRAPRRHLAADGWTWAHYTARSFTYRFRRPLIDVLFYPERLASMHYVLWKICAVLGLRVTQELSQRTALTVLWKDATFIKASEAALPVTSAPIINATCLDISKTNVSRHFSAVFGYSCDVDPFNYYGPCVEKSDENARHDGRIVRAPVLKRRAGAVYQRVINNAVQGDLVEDVRVPVINGIVPFAYLKYRPTAIRFDSSRNNIVRLCPAEEVLSGVEIRNIGKFAGSIGLDYGELDVLRDRDDGQIYIVDANNTPTGPSYRLSSAEFRRAVNILALVFRDEFLTTAYCR
jgi:hypothetical protein